MTDERETPRLRVRVDEDPALTWDIGSHERAVEGQGHVRPASISELPVGSADRAAGLRRFEVILDGWRFNVSAESATRAELRERVAQEELARHHHAPVMVRAPMTGRVVRLWVAEGDTVDAGQRLLAIEAMKMENEVRAPRAGVVASIGVAVDDDVEHGDELVTVR